MRVYSFVRAGNSDIKSFKADIKLFFNYLVQNQQYPANTQNLIGRSFRVDGAYSMLT
jgi:xyloglucan-specific endo-beta-1,4-glucanase